MDLKMQYRQGGMAEFEKTGIYPEYLLFSSKNLKGSWKIKIKSKPQIGKLHRNDKIVFVYNFDELSCKVRKVHDGVEVGNWIELEFIHVIAD